MKTWIHSFLLISCFTPNLLTTLNSTPHLSPPVINTVMNANVSCNSSVLEITVSMKQIFKGILFAKDFSHECSQIGTLEEFLTIHLPTAGCGVRLSLEGDDLFYTVTIVIQQDRYLRQFTDKEYTIKCKLENQAMVINSTAMEEAFLDMVKFAPKFVRQGRMKTEKELDNDAKSEDTKLSQVLQAARAWMEIVPEHNVDNIGSLQVGESALLIIKSTLPVGIGWKVVNCLAHDGIGDTSQKLLNEFGCPVDEPILPTPLYGVPRPIQLMRYQEAISQFAAFKFPDRERLHLSCNIELCRDVCENINCSTVNSLQVDEHMQSRQVPEGQQGEILDHLEVYNSIEVLAPEIDLDVFKDMNTRKNILKLPFGSLENNFCVSPDRMAITFAILGIIFLCAVIISALALMKTRRSRKKLSYYSRSAFSSSSEGSGCSGSKFLMQENPRGKYPYNSCIPYDRVI